jgi:hypothetical protein
MKTVNRNRRMNFRYFRNVLDHIYRRP